MNIQIQSTEARNVLTFAREKHWGFRVLKNEPMISSPVYENGWWYLPAADNKDIIPTNAIHRVEILQELGFKIQGVIVAHEAPKLFCQPKVQPKVQPKPKPVEIPTIDISRVLEKVGTFFLTVMTLFFYVAVSAMMIDPALIVVLEDGTWVEVMRWFDST